jgi:hypothetical protein
MDKQKLSSNSETSTSSQTPGTEATELTRREQRIIRTAMSGKGRWRLYLISLAVLLVVPIQGWNVLQKVISPKSHSYSDYCIPLMVVSIHIILFFKVKQRCDFLALIRKLNT